MEIKGSDIVSEQSTTGESRDIFLEIRKLAEKAELDTAEHGGDDHFWHILATEYLRKRHFYFLSTRISRSESRVNELENRKKLRVLLLEEALRDAEEYYKLEAQTGEDFLTGLPNRKGFQRDFERLLNSKKPPSKYRGSVRSLL